MFFFILRLAIMLLMALFGGWLFYSAGKAVKTGLANAGGRNVRFKKSPALFVVTISAQFGFGLCAFWAVIQLILRF